MKYQAQDFLITKSDLYDRLDPYFYNPKFRDLENRINKRSSKPLADLILSINGGSTPNKSMKERYYTDKNSGIPFLRVQNITKEGIHINDCLYINHQTHNTLLKRSQVQHDDLLVTITGRIASAAVAPSDFVGNINQHVVVISTSSREQSQYLATYINSNIGNSLALRRTTGGTRPALDYKGLLTIPIVENLPIVKIIDDAQNNKSRKLLIASDTLNKIRKFIQLKLGIDYSKHNNDLFHKRIFTKNIGDLAGNRFDPLFYLNDRSINKSKFNIVSLELLTSMRKGDTITKKQVKNGEIPVIAGGQSSPYFHNQSNTDGNVITVSASGAYSGFVQYHENPIYASDCIIVSTINEKILTTDFLYEYLNFIQDDIYSLQHGSGQPHVYISDLKQIKIPVPPLDLQHQITSRVNKMRNQVKQLDFEAHQEFKLAMEKIDEIILG